MSVETRPPSVQSLLLRISVSRLHVLCYFFVFIFFRVAGTVPCRPDLMVKKLRYYARFIVVCLLLKKMKLVRDLVRVSRHSVLFSVVCVVLSLVVFPFFFILRFLTSYLLYSCDSELVFVLLLLL